MKLYAHQFGKHRLRCQFEDRETAKALWEAFLPNVLRHVFQATKFTEDTELPPVHGQGFLFRNEVLTAFGEKYDVVIVDSEGVKELAARVKTEGSPN